MINVKLEQIIDRQTEHTITLARHTVSLNQLEKGQEELKSQLRHLLVLLGPASAEGPRRPPRTGD
ncbi:hypothetical protein [Streptomyces sp. NBC_01264]|uniref:hypothetical protein n=1 Tax=Streptomyces sp. NBC_01264 TaxID=2903804 RepID=UPI00224F856C|nr:hypothetical protein [Streptomyces sp. NBC_01264]MCX4784521.1 hypothetical protein [Streptomyces sp. NBC_01264]